MESLAALRERRAYECRLTPDRALGSLDEADGFLRDRGMLTRTTDCALPSLYEACHEEPFKPGSPGFSTWPATKWPWFGELTERGYLCVAVHRGKNLLVSHQTAALLDPICRAETDRMRAEDAGRRRLLDHLARAGPSSPEDLRLELGLERQELRALRAALERCGALVARPVVMPAGDGEGHTHSSELSRWDQAYQGDRDAPHADPGTALGDLVVAAVRAAVVVREAEARRWFSWPWYWTDTLIADLIRAGRLRRVDAHLAARQSSRQALPQPSAWAGNPGRALPCPSKTGRRRMLMHVAVLGTGIMGTGMAHSMLRSGLDVTVWNRHPGRAEPLAADGAQVAGTAAEAVAGVDAVITTLWDGTSVAEVMADALPAAPDGVLWAQTSTVSLDDASDLLPSLADGCGARYIDAPVLGTRQPAEEGRLTVVAAGPEQLRDEIAPVFGAIAARTVWASERPGDGTRLKLVANSWVAMLVAATAQSIALTEGLGLNPRVFLDMMKGGPTDAAYLHAKGDAIIAGQFVTSFAVDGAVKDTGLIAAAMRESGVDPTLMEAVRQQYGKAAGAGHGEEDMAAIYYAFRS